jgi:hypothetical protein
MASASVVTLRFDEVWEQRTSLREISSASTPLIASPTLAGLLMTNNSTKESIDYGFVTSYLLNSKFLVG